MLTITVLGEEFYDEESEEFSTRGDIVIELEHSLASISKWESKWEKPFLGKEEKSNEEILSYIEMMILTSDIDVRDVISRMSPKNIDDINQYINAKMTATWFKEDSANKRSSSEVITSEIIYYWMVALQIPSGYDTWHLNRLLTLIRVCNQKNQPAKKMSRAEIAARNRQLNAERLAKFKTTG